MHEAHTLWVATGENLSSLRTVPLPLPPNGVDLDSEFVCRTTVYAGVGELLLRDSKTLLVGSLLSGKRPRHSKSFASSGAYGTRIGSSELIDEVVKSSVTRLPSLFPEDMMAGVRLDCWGGKIDVGGGRVSAMVRQLQINARAEPWLGLKGFIDVLDLPSSKEQKPVEDKIPASEESKRDIGKLLGSLPRFMDVSLLNCIILLDPIQEEDLVAFHCLPIGHVTIIRRPGEVGSASINGPSKLLRVRNYATTPDIMAASKVSTITFPDFLIFDADDVCMSTLYLRRRDGEQNEWVKRNIRVFDNSSPLRLRVEGGLNVTAGDHSLPQINARISINDSVTFSLRQTDVNTIVDFVKRQIFAVGRLDSRPSGDVVDTERKEEYAVKIESSSKNEEEVPAIINRARYFQLPAALRWIDQHREDYCEALASQTDGVEMLTAILHDKDLETAHVVRQCIREDDLLRWIQASFPLPSRKDAIVVLERLLSVGIVSLFADANAPNREKLFVLKCKE
uniref:Uncharacterized protein n=1 Tax=Palpitomonas bilix TaxID=652834 RepID=A0A7S3G0D2_9EUKA|mmetsp:Transcript_15484/g.39203  ORF Transcript_15484/g.39203 Transcript_15484/m.39203 type:complete len:508 (+) Transcript_15484:303-1826(+)